MKIALNFRTLRVGLVLAGLLAGGELRAQTLLNFQESPVSSGLLVAQESDEYTATGLGNGVQYLLNAEGGDYLSIFVETELAANSVPRLRLADGDNNALNLWAGSSGGMVYMQSWFISVPGTYRLTVYSDNNPSAYSLQGMLARSVGSESEYNGQQSLADTPVAAGQPGGFQLSVAGALRYDEDYYDLGELAAGNSLTASLQLPNGSSLAAAGMELSLFKEGESTPTTSVTGAALSESIAETARYLMRVRIPGVEGLHMNFKGAGEEVNLGDPANLRITGSQTIEMWIRPEHFRIRQNPIAKAYGGEGTMTQETDGTINYYYGTTGINGGSQGSTYQRFNTGVPLRAGEWQHLAVVRDLDSPTKTLTWYLNGRKIAEAAALFFPAVASSLDFLIGNGYVGNGYLGDLDEVRVWNVARTEQEIIDNLGTPLAGTETGLVSYYKFEEGSGASLTDSGPGANPGTLTGAPTWEGAAGSLATHVVTQGTSGVYLLEVDVTDAVSPTVDEFQPTPVAGYLFDGTTANPGTMSALRGNNDVSYLYTAQGSTGGNIWGTDLYTDDSSISKAAVHTGVLSPGEIGTVRVTVKPGAASYRSSTRFGVTSNSFGSYVGSFEIERYDPPAGFTLDGLYRAFWLQFSEPIDETTLPGGVEILGAGPNGTFGDSDDLNFSESFLEFTGDNRARFDLGGVTLTPGLYRLTVAGSVADRAGNTLTVPYTENFTILADSVAGQDFVNESDDNATFATADDISTDVMPGVFDGSFVGGPWTLGTADRPYDSELADLDGDGHLDAAVIYTGSGDGLRIFAGNGDATFAAANTFPPGTGLQSWSAEYFDNNDFTGASVTRTDDAISFNWGSGSPDPAIAADQWSARWDGAFVAPRTGSFRLRCEADDRKKVWVDLDRSGTYEVGELLIDTGIGVHWTPVFQAAEGLSYNVRMEFVEFTGNAYANLAAYDSMTVLFGDCNDVELVDWDKDNDLDIAVAVSTRDRVELFLNNSTPGNFSFTHLGPVTVGDGPRRIDSGDINNDTFPDMVVSNYDANASTGRNVSVLLNNQSGGFTESKIGLELTPRILAHAIGLAHLDADGNLDLIVGDYGNGDRMVVWAGNGDGTFSGPDFYSLGGNFDPADLDTGDIDQNGTIDVVVSPALWPGRPVTIFPGNGDGTLGAAVTYDTGVSKNVNFVTVRDLNGDSYPDILLGSQWVIVLTNRADGTFNFTHNSRNYGEAYGPSIGDLNEDGRLDLFVPDYDQDIFRVLLGNPKSLLAEDDTNTGVSHGYLRGNLNGSGDQDYFRFTAERGQLLTIAMDNTIYGGGSRRLRVRFYDSVGNNLFTTDYTRLGNGAGENGPFAIPRDGTYYFKVEPWDNYFGEYRFRVSLAPAGTQMESENNDTISNADAVSFTLNGNELDGKLGGYVAAYDGAGDYFNLGNLAAGTEITVDLTKPSTSTLDSVLTLYRSGGVEVAPDTLTGTQLVYLLQAGDEDTYYVRVTDNSGRGLMAEYFLDVNLADIVPPTIVGDTLPAEGSTTTFVAPTFTVTFSEDMLAAAVNDPATYELLGAGGAGDGFGNGNDIVYTVTPNGYSSGLSNGYSIPDGPLQQDDYRFRITTAMKDKLNNPLTAEYVRTWTVEAVPPYVLESRDNNSRATADTLSGNVMPTEFDGTFADAGWTLGTSDRPYDSELADLDGDGNLDAAVVYLGSGDALRLFAGNGDGTFASANGFPAGTGLQPWSAEYFDNNDFTGTSVTRTDEVISFNWGSGSPDPAIAVDQWSARWDGAFVAPRSGSFRLQGNTDDRKKVWVDLDRSGTYEPEELLIDAAIGVHWTPIFAVEDGLSYNVRMEFVELTGNAYAYLTAYESMTVLFSDVNDVELIDWDKDNDLDIVVSPSGQDRVERFRNESVPGKIQFTHLAPIAVGDSPVRIDHGDINNDTFPDLVVANVGTNGTTGRHVSILLNDQAGGFTESKLGLDLTPRVRAHGIALTHLDGDGNLDLVVGDYDSDDRLAVWSGNGDGTFAGPDFYDLPSGYDPADLDVGDINQDGAIDVVVGRASWTGRPLSIFPGNGDGTLGTRLEYDTGINKNVNFVRVLDINGDGYPDVSIGSQWVIVLTNRADGSFGFTQAARNYGEAYGPSYGDVNNDGRIDMFVPDYDQDVFRVLLGNPVSPLVADDTNTGVLHGYARGNLTNNSDRDFFSFSAEQGQRLTIAMDNTIFGGGLRRLRTRFYDAIGNQLFSNDYTRVGNGAGENGPYVIPRDGTYYFQVEPWDNYFGEYRFRVSLSANDGQQESENNNNVNEADPLSFTLNGSDLEARAFGYIATYDTSGDYWNLGTMAAGAQIDVVLTKPSTSPLDPVLRLYDNAGAEVVPDTVTPTNLSYLVPGGSEGRYRVRVSESAGRGLLAEYFLDITIGDTVPPSIAGDTLPTEGTTVTFANQNFTINFSEDMLVSAVRDQATYELLGAGGPGDGFGNGNDVVYTVVPAAYSSGLSNTYHVPDGPLQPDDYRFRITTAMADRNGNALPAEYVRTWTVESVAGYVLEDRDNGTFPTADTISTNVMPGVFDGTFLDHGVTKGTADGPYDSELADLDGDGNLDAAVSYLRSGDGLRLFPGNGDGSFGDPLVFSLPSDTWDLELLDFEKDGDLDVAVVINGHDRVELFLNDSTPGALNFTQLTPVPVGDDPRRIDSGDLNGDTFLDLVVSNHGATASGRSVSILINDMAGGFVEAKLGEALSPRVRPFAIALGDLNKDSKLDIVAGDWDNTQQVVVWLGNGDGTFGAPAFYDFPNAWEPRSLAIGDLNQDSNPDVVVGRHLWPGNELSIYPGVGDGTLAERITYNTGINQNVNFVRVQDINGDSWPDVTVGSQWVTILTNRAEGGFSFTQAARNYGEGYGPSYGDLNNDGAIDLFVPDYDQDLLRVLLGNAKSLLTEDSILTGLFEGRFRGNLTDNPDRDRFSFTAQRGQRLTIAMDNTIFGGGLRRLQARIYDSIGNQLFTQAFTRLGNGAGETGPYTIPRDGTYFIQVEPWDNYFGEYRFRVSLSPNSAQRESEDNNNTGQADGISFALNGTSLQGSIFGFVSSYDSFDYYNLGNLVDGTEISLNMILPSTSTLNPQIQIYDAGNNLKATANPGETSLSYTLGGGDDSTYYARVQAAAGNGLDGTYLLEASLTDLLPPIVTGTNLPVGSVIDLRQSFTVSFNKDLLASTVTDPGNYTLISAGADDLFSTPDDVVYTVSPGAYSSGTSANYSIPNGPLQPGMYEFRVFNLRDTFGNPLPLAYEQQFTIGGVPGFDSESEGNGDGQTWDIITLNTDIPGLLTGAGRGNVSSGSDADNWTFEAEAGDLLVLESYFPQEPNSNLYFQVYDPDGPRIFDRATRNALLESWTPVSLTKTGTYRLRISDWNAVRSEYQFRVTLIRGLDYESENNDDIPTSDPITFTTNGNIEGADVAGFLSANSELDYFDLGPISAGNTVFLGVTYPEGSTLVPIVGLYDSSGVLQGEVNGVNGDDNAEVQITSSGNYHALIRPNLTTAGMMSQYVLNARILPTNAVNFPNLRVTSVTDPPATGTQSGDQITVTFEVANQGNLATGVSAWTDRIVLSPNDAYGDLDDLQVALVARNGALNPSENYLVNHQIAIPDGLFGDFYVFIETDSTNAVDEILQEGDNVGRSAGQFNVALRDYPDLVIENLTITGPDPGDDYLITWDLANRGTGTAPAGSLANLRVINTTSSQTLADLDFASTGALAQDQVEAQSHTVNATAAGFYVATITADPDNDLYEYGPSGHGIAEQNSVSDNFQIFQFYDIAVSPSPVEGGDVSGGGTYREGETVTVQATPNTTVLPYAFVNWTQNGAFVSSAQSYQFTATANRNLVAVFALPQFQITASVSPAGSGTVSGLGTYALDSTASLQANPGAGYIFDRWEESNVPIGNNAQLQFTVTGSRSFVAYFEEATPEHVVTLDTEPAGLAAIPGGRTYMNGEVLNPTAPDPIEQGDFEYLFQRWELNGLFLTTDPTFSKTFTTLDPATMDYVAVYEERSLKPEVQAVATNYGTLVPLADDVVFTVTFDRTMDTGVLPVLTLQSGNASAIPAVPPAGTWLNPTTYQSPAVTFGDQNGGAYSLQVTAATDPEARVMDADLSFGFTVDALPPPNPTLVLGSTDADSANVSWAGYSAPVDLSGFRYYLETTDFTTVDGLVAVSGGNFAARNFTFTNLQPDQDYFAAVTAIDVAGNSGPLVTTLPIRLNSVVPPAVPLILTDTGLDSVLADWSAYDTSSLVGLDGFRVYLETSPFTEVTGLTAVADLPETATSHELTGLDRSFTYYIAVVGYNRLGQFEAAVTPSLWTDPLGGSITASLTIGGAGETIEILSSATLDGGADLIIEPGTTLSFAPGTSLQVNDGRILANGTDLEPIHFTSANEFDPGTNAARGDWSGLILSDPVNVSELAHVWVRYGEGLQVQAGSPVLDGLYGVQNIGAALAASGSASISPIRCVFTVNENGLSGSDSSAVTISDSVIKNNSDFNAAQSGVANLNASTNWWGTSSVPGINAKLDGIVTAATPLTEEPILGAAFATASGDSLTGTQTIDLRLMTANAVSYRLSEDSLFSGVLFEDLFAPDETFRVSPYGFMVPFTLSPGAGLKTVFLQYQSDTGELSPTLSLDVEFITDGPVVSSFNLTEGQVVSRPITVTATASAALGLQQIDFLVDGVLVGRTASNTLSLLWDPRTLPTRIYRVEALARDLAGNVATRAVNVTVSPTPPPAPTITSPASGITVGSPTVTVAGTAEPNISVRLSRNGTVVGSTVTANVNGDYSFADIPLVEGANSFVATAFDALGAAPSATRTVFRDSGPPAAVILDPLIYNGIQRRLTLRWQFMEEGERPTTFQVFWNETPFTDPATATGQSAVTTETITVLPPLPDGTYHFGVVGYDDAGNASPVSNLQVFSVDFSKPQLTVSYGTSLPAGPGTLPITVTTNEALAAPPLLTLRPSGLPSINVPLTGGPLIYTADYAVSDLSARTGNAVVTVGATDLSGNSYVGPPIGPQLSFDMTRPTGALAFDAPPPIQTTTPVLLSLGLTLSEPAAPGTIPSLVFDPPVGSNVTVALAGSGQTWNGTINLTPAMGKGDGFFLLNVEDLAGNNGTVLTEGGTLEVYNTAEPDPPGIPGGLTGEVRSAGEFLIGWNPVPRAETYTILREPGLAGGTPTLVIAQGVTSTSYLDLPPADGFYRYAVVAVLRGVEGAPSGVLEGLSDRTPPDVPENVTANLLARGVEISFAAPSGGEPPARYRVYRNETVIRTITTPRLVTDVPPRGTFQYSVASVDPYGNENRSPAIQIDLLVSPVTNLQVLLQEGQPNALTWNSTDPTVTGFNIYRDGVKQNGAPLANPFYVDPIATGFNPVTYEVAAVNANGDQSPRRNLTAYPLSIQLIVNPNAAKQPQQSRLRYFDEYEIDVMNQASAGMVTLAQAVINRLVGGADALEFTADINLEVSAGATTPQNLILPSPTSRASRQTVQLVLKTEPDASGSTVSYEKVFTAARGVDLGTNVLLSPQDTPLAGGLTDFDVQLFNNGYAPMDVILGRASGTEPGDLSIAVLGATGVEVSRTTFNGVGVPGITIDGSGNVFVTIEPGSNLSLTFPDVFVPSALAGVGTNTEFRAEVAAIYHGLATGTPVLSGPLTGSTRSNLTETPYYGNSSTDKTAYSNTEVVMITGQALDRVTGLPVPEVPLRIGFGARGFVVYEDVMTDTNGDYSFDYTPPIGFSGELNIWAAHPLIVDQLNQVTINYLRMYVTPQGAQIIMSENDTQDFNLTLINPGNSPLTGVTPTARIFIIDEFDNEIDITSIRLEQIGDAVDLGPNRRTDAPLRLTADLGAPPDAMLELSLVSQEGASANFTATISLRPAVPVLSFFRPAIGYVDMSVNRGEINSQTVVLENLGLRPLEGVELIKPANLTWMSVNLPRQSDGRIILPNVPVGGRLSFDVVYTPPADIPLGLYDDFLLIRGSNAQADFQVNLFAQITSGEKGEVKFFFDNIFVEPVPNATVRLRNPNLRQELGPFTTDANGELIVPDLQEGPWSWKVTAAGHTSFAGTVEVLANQTVLVEQRLSKSLVTVEFTVVPVPFTDRYEIIIEQTFQTRVPFPVLVMDPPSFNFQDLPEEFEATVLVTLKNEGLIRMFDCTVDGSAVSEASFLPLITYFPELKAQEQVTVPFKFRFNQNGLVLLGRDGDARSASAVGDAVSDCWDTLIDPTDFLKGLFALAEAAARCQDGAAAQARARAIVMFAGGFALGASLADPVVTLAVFIGCVAGELLNLGGAGGGVPVGGGGPGGGGGGFISGYCFPAGTMVTLDDRSTIPIEQLRKGQSVLTSQFGDQSGKVGDVIVRTSNDLLEITARPAIVNHALPEITLQLTGDHVVWSDRRGWIAARELQIGEWLHDDRGNLYELMTREAVAGEHTVYTVDVEGDSAFYANRLLVQDLCGYQKAGDQSLFGTEKEDAALEPAATATVK